MESTEQLIYALRSGYSFFYAQTYEMQRALEAIINAITDFKNEEGETIWKVAEWNMEKNPDPEAVLETLEGAENRTVVIARNFHWFLADEYGNVNKSIATFLQNRFEKFTTADSRKALVILGDVPFDKAIPEVLAREFLPLEFPLPNKEEVEKIVDYIIDSVKDNGKFIMPSEKTKSAVIDAAKGMTARDVNNALSYSLVTDGGKFKPLTVSRLKAKDIEKTPGLHYREYPDDITVIGYEDAKNFFLDTYKDPDALGVIFVGPAGTGKTMFCHWAASQTGLPVLEWEMAEMMGEGLVGQAEASMKRAIDVAGANAPCIIFMDEIEKGLSGSGNSGGANDGGTTKRSTSQLLKFLSDNRPEGVYIMATCNNIRSIAPEWLRAERWDCAPWYVGLPDIETQKGILKHYKKVYSVKGEPENMEGWSGAEIKSVCRIAKMMGKDVGEVEKYVIPISVTMKEEINELESWAKGRTNPAQGLTKLRSKKSGKKAIEI